MDIEKVIHNLNWFYSLELNQVDLYIAQSKSVEDLYLKKTLERIAVIEQQHADNIADKIKELGRKPTKIGDFLGPLSGKITGKITGLAGAIAILKVDITLEEKAMADYKDFILKSGSSKELFDLLWSNLIDEDLHTAWFANKLKELEEIQNDKIN